MQSQGYTSCPGGDLFVSYPASAFPTMLVKGEKEVKNKCSKVENTVQRGNLSTTMTRGTAGGGHPVLHSSG